jgi:hypothetical protein
MLIMLAESRHRRCKLLRHPAYAGLVELAALDAIRSKIIDDLAIAPTSKRLMP